MGMEILLSAHRQQRAFRYLDIVALIAGFEDYFLELFDPHSSAGRRVRTEMVDSI